MPRDARPADALEAAIDDLYRLAPGEFTAARNALAKTETGEARTRVRALEKPTAVPWAVNQLYWQARSVFDRLVRAGAALRAAQIHALEGRPSHVPDAAAVHREAVAAALGRARALAEAHGVRPADEPLARMLEALSLAPALPAPPGRFTQTMQPSGFEAMAGVAPAPSTAEPAQHPAATQTPKRKADTGRQAAARQHERRQATIVRAQAAVAAAENAEDRARSRLEVAREQVGLRESELAEARDELRRARAALRSAEQRS